MDRFFEWDSNKAASNLRKHGIRFEEAVAVFDDPNARSHAERVENGELRWQTIGRVDSTLVVLVAHTVMDDEEGEVIRIISARRADRTERKRYEQSESQTR